MPQTAPPRVLRNQSCSHTLWAIGMRATFYYYLYRLISGIARIALSAGRPRCYTVDHRRSIVQRRKRPRASCSQRSLVLPGRSVCARPPVGWGSIVQKTIIDEKLSRASCSLSALSPHSVRSECARSRNRVGVFLLPTNAHMLHTR